MFGLMGLVVDIGWAYWRREAAKTAAEAAVAAVVLAAGTTTPTAQSGTACPSSPDPLVAWQVGCIYASQNGFTQGVSRRSVSIQIGNGSTGIPVGGVSPNKYWVAATVSESMPTLFSAVLGKTNMTVSARSTSAVYNGSPGGCIYVLNGTANNAFKVSGGTTNGACGFYVNSTSTSSFNLTGGNINLGTSGAKINLHAGSISPWPPTGGTVLPSLSSVQMSQPAVSNPITGLTAPTAGSCTPDPNITSGTHTLTQGTYCSGITIKGGTVTLSAGLYQFTNAGANFKISGGSQYVDATAGVTLYFAPGAGQLVVSGNGLNLTAPVGGTWDGIAVWKASSCSPLPGCDNWSWTGGNVNVNGVIDLPNSFLKYTGGATGVAQTIVCDTFETTGGNITGPASSKYFTGSGSGSGGGGAYLVE
jgi:hypothetical protein